MDEYHHLAEQTRTLEQEYTSLLAKRCHRRIQNLQKEVARARAAHTHATAALEKRCAELERQCSEYQQALAAAENAKAEATAALEERLAEQERKAAALANEAAAKQGAGREDPRVLALLESLAAAMKRQEARSVRIEEGLARQAGAQAVRGSGKETEQELRRALDECRRLREECERLEGQKNTLVLLQEAAAGKDRIIEQQAGELERLRRQAEGMGGWVCGGALGFAGAGGAGGGEAAVADGMGGAGGAAGKGGRKAAAGAKAGRKGAGKAAAVQPAVTAAPVSLDLQKLIKGDNEAFFNNMSFMCSSPAPDRTHPRL